MAGGCPAGPARPGRYRVGADVDLRVVVEELILVLELQLLIVVAGEEVVVDEQTGQPRTRPLA